MSNFSTNNPNPDLEYLKEKLSKFTPKGVGGVVMLLLAGVFIISSFFTIELEEVGVVMRFGKYNRTVNPGLNFKMPFGVETVHKVPVQRQLKEEFGFRTVSSGVRTTYSNKNYNEESIQLTGDLNAADVQWIVQYRIKDAFMFLFKVRNPQFTFRDLTEAIVRQVIGDRTVNEVLTVGRADIAAEITKLLQEMTDQYELGIKVDQVVLQDVNPPEEVKSAFNEVNEAQQEKEKLINQARAAYNKVIPKARGQAERAIEEAKGYALERVNEAKGDVARFTSIYQEYAKARQVTRDRIYLESMGDILERVEGKIITDNTGSNVLPLLHMNKQMGNRALNTTKLPTKGSVN